MPDHVSLARIRRDHRAVRLRTIADPVVLRDLTARLSQLTPDTRRRWGTLTAHEVLCHLGDATAMVLRDRPRVVPVDGRARPLRKGLGLWSPLRLSLIHI